MTRIFFILFFLSFGLNCFGQLNDTKIRQEVLKLNHPDSLCVYGKWTENGGTETRLKYLGSVTTTHGKVFKIMTSIWVWGYSKHATSRILIFNDQNQYVGNYHLSMTYDIPDKLENGKLIFTNDDPYCDPKLVTKIDLTHGLPKSFFLKCKGEYGDIYTFSP